MSTAFAVKLTESEWPGGLPPAARAQEISAGYKLEEIQD